MASSGNVTLSFLSDEVESQAAETTRSWLGTTVTPEGNPLTWIWILVPFACAFAIFICFECFLLGLPCRRRRYYTRSFDPSKSNTTLSDARSTTTDDDIMTSRGHRTATSMSSSHDIIRHTSMTDCCSICGNTASGDVIMGVSSFKRNRHRHYHHRAPDGAYRHHDHRNNLLSHHVRLKDHSSSGYMNDEDSVDFDRSGESSAYGSQHGTHADRYFASETSIAPRSTDFDEESYTPRYTPTVSRSISESVDVEDGYLQGEREPVTSPMRAYYPGIYKGLYDEENAGPASLSTFSDNSRLYLSQPSSDIETSVHSHLSNGTRYEQTYRHHHPRQHQHYHQHRPHRHHGNPSALRIDRNTYPKRNLNERSSTGDEKHRKPPPAYVPRQVKHCYIGNPFDEISVTVTGMV